MVNILLRTSNRPKGFARTIECLRKQTDKNFKLFVSVDNKETKEYVEKENFPCEIVEVEYKERENPNHNPYNLYVNKLKEKTKSGWNIVIDDDDFIYENMVQTINKHCTNEDVIYIFKMEFINKVIPSIRTWRKGIAFGDISSPCIVINAKHKNVVDWKPIRGGDFNYIKDLIETKKFMIGWVDDLFYKVIMPGGGKRHDIQ